ncbi:hypothetical protein ACKWTF_000748 [Chironomus riparius]
MKSKIEDKFARLKFVPPTFEVEHLQTNVFDNYNYFCTHKNPESSQLASALQKLNVNLEKLSVLKVILESRAREFDYDENTPGNGFWSYIHNFGCAVKIVRKICNQLTKNRDKMLFNKKSCSKELELWNEIFESLIQICDVLLKMLIEDDKKVLVTADNNWATLNRLMSTINQKAFYGTAVGFQCVKSMKPIVNVLVSSLVGYSKFHYSDKHKSIRLLDFNFSTSKYFLKPKHRGHKFVASSEKGDIEFCKKFWFMTELDALHTLPNVFAHKIAVNKTFKIPAEPMQTFSDKHQKFIDIPLPHSHFETKPVSCRLMSMYKRDGMMSKKSPSSKSMPKSKHLVFHVHGGGWAAQTSKSHEIYLKQWACHVQCPILSIDYSLTPMAPFPRAIEEIYYAYCWALNNFDKLGTTGERIVFAGDSAGANLNTAILVKCIEEGIRTPDGIVNIYGIFNVDFLISPSGSLTVIDPMLPFGMTSNLIKTYGMDLKVNDTSVDSNGNIIVKESEAATKNQDKFNFTFTKSYLLSPYKAPEEILRQFPKTIFVSAILDPLLDDSILLGTKLRDLDVATHLDVLGGLYHGFLYFIKFSKECRDASLLCADHIKKLLEDD